MAKGGAVTFWNGRQMPLFGLGMWQSPEEEVEKAIDAALEAGYRHIDTAYMYKNEAAIGKALKKWFDSGKIRREDLFIVTKLPMVGMRPEKVEKYLNRSLTALQLSYVDLYLIHGPVGFLEKGDDLFPRGDDGSFLLDLTTDHIALWKKMEEQVDVGKAHSIGLSNFSSRQIKRVVKAARIRPANLQVELHVYFQQRELVAFCEALDITVCAYSPIGSPAVAKTRQTDGWCNLTPMTDPVVIEIADKHKKTPAQVLLKHIIQRGIVVIPKSVNPDRIRQNFQVFDFNLDEHDVLRLDSLDKRSQGRLFDSRRFKGLDAHPESMSRDRY